jgi:hypothetical protein
MGHYIYDSNVDHPKPKPRMPPNYPFQGTKMVNLG